MKKNRNSPVHTNEESGKTDFIIEPLLPIGKENAITTQELMRISGCGSSRELRQRIALERERGAIICSGSGRGYWKPKNRQEIQEFIKVMDARAWNTLKAAKGAKKALRTPEGQQSMKGDDENGERRMFSKDVVCSDRFLDMPASAQALYFQYGLEADDDGFVSAPKKILRLTNASDDDLKILVAKGFLIPFDSGVVVIRDWKINNYLRRDRYTPTRFKEEFEQLDTIDDRYQLHVLAVGIPDDNHVVDMRDTQVRLGKDSIGKGSINNNEGRKMSHFTPPTVEEVQEYCFERGNAVDAQSFVDFYTSKGWYVGKTKMKDWKAAVRTWEKNQKTKK